MKRPLQALVWEIWRRGWKVAVVILALGILCAMVNDIVPDKKYLLRNLEAVYWVLMVVSLFLTFSVFHYAEHNRTKNWSGFPYRLFWLPVPTGLLVACPMVLGVISVEVVYWIWAKLVFGPLGRSVSFWPAACLGVGMICYQAIIWGLAGFRITRIIVLSFTGLLLINLGMAPLLEEIKIWSEQDIYRWAIIALVLMGIIATFGGWFSVERQRRGGGRGRGRITRWVMGASDALPRWTRPFASPAAAQFWFEWRRCGQLLPMCAAAVLLLVCAPISWFTRGESDSVALTVVWAFVSPLVLAAVIGQGFGKADFWSADLSVPPFLAVRPLASGEMIVTKLRVAVLSVVVTWLLVIGFLGCYLPLWADRKSLQDMWSAALMMYTPRQLGVIAVLGLVAAAIFCWRMLVGGLWIAASGNRRLAIGYGVVQVITLVLFVWGLARVSGFPFTVVNQTIHNLRWIGWALVGVAVLKLGLSFWSWRRIGPARTRTYMALWWAGTICLVGLVLAINPRFAAIKHVCILLAFLPLPLARLGLAPSFLANNRHRK